MAEVKRTNHAFGVAMADLRERADKLARQIASIETLEALTCDTELQRAQADLVMLRLLVDASKTASGVFEELSTAVDAMSANA